MGCCAQGYARVLERAGEPLEGVRALLVMNHENGGFDCPGYAWPDDVIPSVVGREGRRRGHLARESANETQALKHSATNLKNVTGNHLSKS